MIARDLYELKLAVATTVARIHERAYWASVAPSESDRANRSETDANELLALSNAVADESANPYADSLELALWQERDDAYRAELRRRAYLCALDR